MFGPGARSAALRLRVLLVAASLMGVSGGPSRADETIDVLRQIRPLETETGVVKVRDAFELDVTIPARCPTGGLLCDEERHFPRLISVEFTWEQVRVEEGAVERLRESRGALHIALHYEDEAERAFEERLQESLAALSAASFAAPFAGLDAWLASTAVAEDCIEPCFICFEQEESSRLIRYGRRLDKGGERVVSSGTTSYQENERTRRFCRDLESATAAAHPETLRTVAMPRSVETVLVQLEVADRLPEEIYANDLAPLPDGASSTVKPAPEGVESYSKTSWSSDTETYYSERAFAGEVFMANAVPGEMPRAQVAERSWIGRWRIVRATEQLGRMPAAGATVEQSLTTVLLPTHPPRREDSETAVPTSADEAHAVAFDQDAFIHAVARQLDQRAAVTAEVLEEIVSDTTAGLGAPAWILIVCRDDGTGHYWLPPTPAHSRVTNPDLFCAAAERQLGLSEPTRY